MKLLSLKIRHQYTHYLYDVAGNRVKKLVRQQNGDYDSISYIDGIFEYRTDGSDKQSIVHLMDDQSRIATVREGDDFGDTTPAVKYVIEDHLGSSVVEMASSGANVNREEYYPFGETSFGSYSKKRYKFCGKERDQESGVYYYGARYYCAWTCRFISVDPLAANYPFYTPYNYAGNKPINKIDIDGLQEEGVEEAPTDPGDNTPTNELPDFAGLGLKLPLDQLPQEKFTSRDDNAIEVTSPRGDKVILGGIDNIAVRGDNTTWGFTTISGENYRWHNDVGEYLLNTSNTTVGENSFPLMKGEMTYAGENNPKSATDPSMDDFSLPPMNIADYKAMHHDISYSYIPGAEGKEGTNMMETIPADIELITGMNRVIEMYQAGEIDPWTGYAVSEDTYKSAVKMKSYFTGKVVERLSPVYKNSMFIMVTLYTNFNPKTE